MVKKETARTFADDSRRTMTEPGTFSHNNVYTLSLRSLASDQSSQGCASMANWVSAWLSNRMPGYLVKHYFRVISVDTVYWVQQTGLLNMMGYCVSVEGGNKMERQRWVLSQSLSDWVKTLLISCTGCSQFSGHQTWTGIRITGSLAVRSLNCTIVFPSIPFANGRLQGSWESVNT